jgi:peptide-methionine (S)-S-oxide reductase
VISIILEKAVVKIMVKLKLNIMHLLLLVMVLLPVTTAHASTETLIVAGGCFWCVESDYEKYKGVLTAESGYINGHVENPTYNQVASKKTGHFEAVKMSYDATKVSLQELTAYFWRIIDPTDANGQFCDKGSPYKSALFYQTPEQKNVFTNSLNNIKKNKPFTMPVVTEILPAGIFYPAEDYHQDYAKKNPLRYKFYRTACRRDARIEKIWGDVASEKSH